MKTSVEILKAFWRDEEGLEMAEYAVVGTLIILGTVAAFTTLGTNITSAITRIANTLGT